MTDLKSGVNNLDTVKFDYYSRIGAHLFPIPAGQKSPTGIVASFKSDASADHAQWKAWRTAHTGCNFGIVAYKSRLIIVDIDVKIGRDEAWALWTELCKSWGIPVAMPAVQSPSGGWHCYFAIPADIDPATLRQPDAIKGVINVRVVGYTVAAGSTFEGKPYTLLTDADPYPAPAALIEHCKRKPIDRKAGTVLPGSYNKDDVAKLYSWLAERGAFESYEDWINAGFAAKIEYGDSGFELWALCHDETVTPDTATRKWESFSYDADAHSVTLNTFLKRAHEQGWTGSVGKSAAGMFAGLPERIAAGASAPPPQPINPDLLTCNPPMPGGWQEEEEPEPALAAPQPFVWRDPSTIPLMPWLYGKHLLRGCVSLTVAAPGVGKTLEKIAETVAMVTGLKLLHDTPKDKLRCWFYNGEEPMDILERRFHACFIRHKIKPEMLGDRLFVNDRTTKMVIAKQTRDGVTISEPVKELLINYILENKIDVLSIDPFISAHAVTENDNVAIDQVVKAYADVAQVTNCSIELVHHVRKTDGGPITIEDARGASSAIGAARAARTMNFMQPAEAKLAGIENRYRYVRIDDGKPNHAARGEKAQWVQLDGVWLGNDGLGFGDNVGVVTPWQWPDLTADVKKGDLSALWTKIADGNGKFRKDPRAANWIGHPIAHVLGLDLETAKDMATVKQLIAGWIKDGFLVTEEREDEKRRTREFVDLGPKAMPTKGADQ